MGEEMYVLHDNGRKLFTSPQDCTPMQRFTYIIAKDHHTEDHDADRTPHGMNKAKQFNNAASKFS